MLELNKGSGILAAKSIAKAKESRSFMEKSKKFFRGVWSELKKVHWPNRKELVNYTMVVLVATLAVSAMIWIVDSLLSFLLEFIL